ncbi:hypothetical protein EDC01DRAFT_271477 [Geopyxis carbonaria]|nr:hypothetical protein EDC01DRAFT_271477 [Geopyxis carbonaria]
MVAHPHQLPSDSNSDDLNNSQLEEATPEAGQPGAVVDEDPDSTPSPSSAELVPTTAPKATPSSEETNSTSLPLSSSSLGNIDDLISTEASKPSCAPVTEPNVNPELSTEPSSDAETTLLRVIEKPAPTTASDDEEPRPMTPAKDEIYKPAVASPPPPSPPPKDLPPKAALPIEPPPKDLPPKDVSPRGRINIAPLDPNNDRSASPNGRLYLDPPLTPVPSRPSSPIPSPTDNSAAGKAVQPTSDDEHDDTRSEIHDLFEKSHRASITGESLQRTPSQQLGSPLGSPALASASLNLPPRSSSLSETSVETSTTGQTLPLRERPTITTSTTVQSIGSVPGTPATPQRPPPPDDDLPFDFHRFLSQLRHRSADPVARFLRSFLSEFAKKQWMVHEQVKIIRDFLVFIYGKMDQCDVWREVGDTELDNAQEGMEKLVMNRLYTQTFSPAIPSPDGKSRIDEKFPGRRGQHQEDVERDEVLTQKVRIYSWIREEHLDIGDTVTGEGGRRFLDLAVKEMLKIGSYRAPRDKVICVLNCCKVIFGLLRHSKSDESADKFVPLLIYVVLRANPEHLVSNVQYILRFRNPDKLNGEAGYYLSSLMGAIQFIENLDRSSLTITPEEFEANVEAAVAAIAERPAPPPPPPVSEKPQPPLGRASTSSRESTDEISDEKAAVAGLLRTIQKPLTTIGRIFSDDTPSSSGPALTPQPGNTPRHSPNPLEGTTDALLTAVGGRRHQPPRKHNERQEHPRLMAEEAAARQASAEAEEARRIGRIEYENVVEILKGMFPALDREIIGDVVRMKEGRVGLAVDACLALSSTS